MIEKAIAMILGGGVGSRLYPLTMSRSKPAVPVVGKYRLIDIPISNCLNSDLRRIFVLTQYNSASLNKHVKKAYHFDIFHKGFVDILAAEQTRKNLNWFLGTADAIRQSMPRLANFDYKYIIVLSGDQLYQMDINDFLQAHIDANADMTVATIPVIDRDAPGFGIMKINKEKEIIDFVEKPHSSELGKWHSPVAKKYIDEKKIFLASMGIYIFNKEALIELFEKLPDANDFGQEIIPFSVNNKEYKVGSYLYDGYWTDIGSISSYFRANLYLTEYLPQFNFFDNNNPIYSSARMLAPSKIFGTRIKHVLVSDGCIIHADLIERCIIGIRSRIGKNTTIMEAIISGNDYYQTLKDMEESSEQLLGIGDNCYIYRAILDKNVKIGNNVNIKGADHLKDTETDTYCIKDGIVIVKKGAIIPDNSIIGDT